jgi:hypothetical protein
MSTYAYYAIAYLCAISTLSFVVVIPTIHGKAFAQTEISLGYEFVTIIVSRNFQRMGLLLEFLELVESR